MRNYVKRINQKKDKLSKDQLLLLIEDVIEEKKIRKKTKGKRDEDLKNLDKVVIPLEIPEEKLNELFPNGYKRLPDEVYKRL